MACPYFMPTERLAGELWPHRARLPLGDGWAGYCTAPGYEGAQPSDAELREGCNLGYASACPRLPHDRPADSVRFALARQTNGAATIVYVCELAHAPAGHGALEYDLARAAWREPHPDPRIQRMAECYLEAQAARLRNPTS